MIYLRKLTIDKIMDVIIEISFHSYFKPAILESQLKCRLKYKGSSPYLTISPLKVRSDGTMLHSLFWNIFYFLSAV
jgi:hypothetical protein